MSRFHDDSTAASDPIGVGLDRARLRHVHRRGPLGRVMDQLRHFEDVLDEHLQLGDSRAALVLSTSPLNVAAYTDELDCSVVLRYDDRETTRIVTGHPDLRVGTRLLTVNTYFRGEQLANDLWHGPASFQRFANFYPVIADFYCSDAAAVNLRKAAIGEPEWARCAQAAAEYLKATNGACRIGSPWKSILPPANHLGHA